MPAVLDGVAGLPTDIFAVAIITGLYGRVLRFGRSAAWAVGLLVVVTIGWSVVGLLQGVPDIGRLLGDARPLLRVAATISIAIAVVDRLGARRSIAFMFRIATCIAVFSLGALLLTLSGLDLFSLRTETANLWAGNFSSLSEQTRVSLPSSEFLAIMSVAAIAASSNLPLPGFKRWQLSLLVACGPLVAVTGYSRSLFLVMLIGPLLLLLLGPNRVAVLRTVLTVLGATALVLLTLFLASESFHLNIWRSIAASFEAFSGRVLNGLTPEAIALDASARWRDREAEAALSYVSNHFITGSGLGSPYRTYLFGEIFRDSYGLTYIHNSYLWALVKLGIVGSLALAVAFFLSARGMVSALFDPCLRAPSGAAIAIAGAVAVISAGSPTPFDPNGSAVVGLILASGLVLAELRVRGRDDALAISRIHTNVRTKRRAPRGRMSARSVADTQEG